MDLVTTVTPIISGLQELQGVPSSPARMNGPNRLHNKDGNA